MTIALIVWLSIVFVAWGALSILVTPLIGQYLAEALHEPREKHADLSKHIRRSVSESAAHMSAKLAPPWVHSKNAPPSDLEIG